MHEGGQSLPKKTLFFVSLCPVGLCVFFRWVEVLGCVVKVMAVDQVDLMTAVPISRKSRVGRFAMRGMAWAVVSSLLFQNN